MPREPDELEPVISKPEPPRRGPLRRWWPEDDDELVLEDDELDQDEN